MSGSGELGGTDSLPPQDTAPAVPPYEGRRETADVGSGGDRTSPADDEVRQDGPDVPTDPGVGPAHTAGTGRAEDES